MINPDDLWIGDEIFLIKSQRVGKFDGVTPDGKIRVKISSKTIITTPSNVKPYQRKILSKADKLLMELKNDISVKKTKKLLNTIDLHIDVLNPSMANALPERIVSYQVQAAKNFIDQAVKNHLREITIIHGKGEGVLRQEIHHLIKMSQYVHFFATTNDGGATEIILKQH